tara:strand:+ start:629 stop:988 length:360 start_codon:yes stop_codon:yes gene_type:complete
MMRSLLLVLLISLPSIVFGEDMSGTGWFFEENNGDKEIILFEKDGTFTYLQVVMLSGGEGEVYSDEYDTYSVNEDLVVISFTGGYKICSLTIDSRKDRMSGTCINKKGIVNQIKGRLIE